MPRIDDGDHLLSLTYRDGQGQRYVVTTSVRLLPPERYAVAIASMQAAIELPLWEEDEQVYVPVVKR